MASPHNDDIILDKYTYLTTINLISGRLRGFFYDTGVVTKEQFDLVLDNLANELDMRHTEPQAEALTETRQVNFRTNFLGRLLVSLVLVDLGHEFLSRLFPGAFRVLANGLRSAVRGCVSDQAFDRLNTEAESVLASIGDRSEAQRWAVIRGNSALRVLVCKILVECLIGLAPRGSVSMIASNELSRDFADFMVSLSNDDLKRIVKVFNNEIQSFIAQHGTAALEEVGGISYHCYAGSAHLFADEGPSPSPTTRTPAWTPDRGHWWSR